MKYLGSKRRIASELNNIMQPYYSDYGTFVDAFVGGGNLIKAITHPNRMAYDINEYVIAYFNALKDGWLPPKDVSEELYKDIKNNKEKYPKELVCFVGFAVSFGGKWFGGYARDRVGRNYATIGFNSCINKDLPYIKPITFIHSDYRNIIFNEPSIIYCDPPYKGVTGYRDKFCHDEFYTWLIERNKDGHKLFISEYEMPNDFTCIWSKDQSVYLDNNTNKPQKRTEKLFTL